MSEGIPTTPPQESPSDDHFTDNKEMNDDMLAQRQAQLDAERAAEVAKAAKRAKRIGNLKTAGYATVGVGSAVVIGAGIGNAIVNQADQVSEQNQQWQHETTQNENEFYQENGILPPEMEEAKQDQLNLEPTPPPDEIPSPTQQSVDVQLPTLPTEKQKN